MADTGGSGKSWWATMPGVLTAVAGIITAVAGLVAILAQSGLVGGRGSPDRAVAVAPASGQTPAASPQGTPGATVAATPEANTLPPPAALPPIVHSPAEVLTGLRSIGFKGLAVTHANGTVVALAPGAEIHGQMLPLTNGQKVQFERVVSVEIEQPWDGSATVTLTNGQRLAAKLNDYNLDGKNELGPYRELLPNLKRIDFVR